MKDYWSIGKGKTPREDLSQDLEFFIRTVPAGEEKPYDQVAFWVGRPLDTGDSEEDFLI